MTLLERRARRGFHIDLQEAYGQAWPHIPEKHRDEFQDAIVELIERFAHKQWGSKDGDPVGHIKSSSLTRYDSRVKNAKRVSKRYTSVAYDSEQFTGGPQPIDKLFRKVELVQITDILVELSDEQRRALALSVGSGLSAERIAKIVGTTPVAVRHLLSRATRLLKYHIELAASGERCRVIQELIPEYVAGELSPRLADKVRKHIISSKVSKMCECRKVAHAQGVTLPRILIPVPALFDWLGRLWGGEGVLAKTGVAASGATASGSALLTAGSGKLAILGCTSVLCVGGIGLGVREVTKPTKPPIVKTKPNPAVVSGALASVGEELRREIKSSKKKAKKKTAPPAKSEHQNSTQPTTESQEPVQVAHGNPEPDPAEVFEEDAEPVQVAHGNPEPDPSEVFGEDAKP